LTTVSDMADAVPFWRHKRLEEMTETEWESLCDGCGRCCLEKLEADDNSALYPLDVGCKLLDPATGRCSDYPNRLSRVPGCVKLTPVTLPDTYWLPPTCGYRRVMLGQDLDWWHPLVSGDANTVRHAGVCDWSLHRAASRRAAGKPHGRLAIAGGDG
jgi:uncharacterized protein